MAVVPYAASASVAKYYRGKPPRRVHKEELALLRLALIVMFLMAVALVVALRRG